ncbi:DUF2207 domain-containing protein [Alkalihalophilus lindianensis]|uniref:DUF2207 domain-containing protein n=1 Tax=Alkalihalophilus lindianensis TaxID=1630542 RepID=A0ABU3X953_9BACI|nr:DUF2207 domain-containing protein [Alkalihalophilus lindianensis]MDV2684399.1 DUF2207 domain-containing protein [Alkalihalophilus lindianensis]
MNKRFIAAILIAILFFTPTEVLAVDYDITNVDIHAYLQPNGNVTVQEQHTYAFSGTFGGMIRELIPKEGTEIVQLEAFEGNNPLPIETDQTEHRIHREGNDETVTMDLHYEIKNGVDVYADVAEFHWPFFDKGNQSTYENLTIYVYPPTPTTSVIAYGYDEAYKTENVSEGGIVQFAMGEVPRKRNGDIRVAYNKELFPAGTQISNKRMHDEIVADKQALIDAEVSRTERRELLSSIGLVIVPIFAFIFLFVLFKAWLESKRSKKALIRELSYSNVVPKATLSLPIMICYMNFQQFLPETIVAALLDLVRKGHVKKVENDRFRLVNQNGMQKHEQKLVKWLFTEIGSESEFSFDDIATYLKNKNNHKTYQELKANWEQAVREDLKEAGMYKNKGKYRFMIGFISFLLVPFIILFAVHGLMALMILSLVICFSLLLFAICYYPRTVKGLKLTLEWRHFKQQYPTIMESTWHTLTEDEKMRAFILGLGMKDKNITKKNESLVQTFQASGAPSTTAYGFDPTFLIIAAAATSNFRNAEQNAGIHGSSGSFTGGGSGAGGGGGGSGAF